jgi:isoaspartyl peptidase/L-asparaginase-like protein (Ntn-hydrolase superfamily)
MGAIIVHGGAGHIPVADRPKRQEILNQAAEAGLAALRDGPLLAVERAINLLEDSDLFNAGRGGAMRLNGEVSLDASVMTSDLRCGAVASMRGICHAISIARLVMEETPYVLLVGRAANELALQYGFQLEDLRTDRNIRRWLTARETLAPLSYKEQLQLLRRVGRVGEGASNGEPHGTVGAVAWADDERLAAGTSTGGVASPVMHEGRVGDTPVIGAGTYCNVCGGASATGVGEAIVRATLTREVVRLIESGAHPQEAAEKAIAQFAQQTGSEAGVIALDRQGHHGIAFNTETMQTAYAHE